MWRKSALAVLLGLAILACSSSIAGAAPGGAVKIAAGVAHTCAILDDGSVRCWGSGADGRLGYGNVNDIGDDETPASAGPVDLGGHIATAIAAGERHTCAILEDATVRCWGSGAEGRLGYADTNNIGEVDTPGSFGPVDLGPGRTAVQIAAGGSHTCALLDDGDVRCWGRAAEGQLGYANTTVIGDTETPGSAGPVDLGLGRTALAITAGSTHTCAILDDGTVRCWGNGLEGRLGYGNTTTIGDTETPGSIGTVDLGAGRTAAAISAGFEHTCAILDDGTLRCWGRAVEGQLGYGNTTVIGDTETPGSIGTVALGAGRTAVQIASGTWHTCALLDNAAVRCWGLNDAGELGYGNPVTIGDTETPESAGPVDLGAGRTATAITTGTMHTCAILDDSSMRCWGSGENGRLGYGNTTTIGDNETPASVGPLALSLTPESPLPAPALATPPVPAPAPASPTPTAGQNVNVQPIGGSVATKCPGDKRFEPLLTVEQIALGCLVDTQRGTVLLTASKGAGRGTQSALFRGGVFRVTQKAGRGQDAVLTLAGGLKCGGRRLKGAGGNRLRERGAGGSSGRKLWGSGKGNFKTVGQYGSAGVRGTTWLVADRCDDSTLIQVEKGTVVGRDFVKEISVVLRTGERYVARARD